MNGQRSATYTMEYYSTIQKQWNFAISDSNEILLFLTILEGIILNEMSNREKYKYNISLIHGN